MTKDKVSDEQMVLLPSYRFVLFERDAESGIESVSFMEDTRDVRESYYAFKHMVREVRRLDKTSPINRYRLHFGKLGGFGYRDIQCWPQPKVPPLRNLLRARYHYKKIEELQKHIIGLRDEICTYEEGQQDHMNYLASMEALTAPSRWMFNPGRFP